MKKVFAFLVISSMFCCAESQVTFLVETPIDTPSDKAVFISGDFEGWSGGREQFKLSKVNDVHVITVAEHKNPIQYKFTLGGWEYVETDAEGNTIANRFYNYSKPNDTVIIKIGAWSKPGETPKRKSTASGNVKIFDLAMEMPQLNSERRIWVYLPPNYENSNKNYPVLYMHDGQNIFDVATSYAGEWGVDETLNDLFTTNGFELIVVGIDNGGEKRMNEYAPWENPEVKQPQGDAYIDFVAKTLKPKIDKAYRTQPEREHTGIMGSSMGGLISHYGALKYPDVFGKAGVFSSSFWISDNAFKYAETRSNLEASKMYFLIGGREGRDMVKDTKRMVKLMKKHGFNANNITSKIVAKGTHGEGFWRSEFKEAILWLYPELVGSKKEISNKIEAEQLTDAVLASGSLWRVNNFPSSYITPRPVDIWLPENYSEAKKYTVLYMHDGQNLFDSTTTWNGQEWKVDDWATKLVAEDVIEDFIVVGIHNIPNIRWQDLFPEKAMDYMDATVKDSLVALAKKNNFDVNFKGDDYLKFLVDELKPFIDAEYAVKTGPEHTFVAGSSMGGLMSMYAVSEYPKVFGGAACLSTHWVGAMPMPSNPYPEAIFKYMSANFPEANNKRMYFDYGNKTLDQHYPQYAPKVDRILKEKGYTETNSRNLFFDGTDHSENSWNKRLDVPLTFLLKKN